ncbi:uncharacterized, partial [Tachysurus ichikawai]
CGVETVANGEDIMQSSQHFFPCTESCTFMAFVSGDFCQAQHLVIVDK